MKTDRKAGIIEEVHVFPRLVGEEVVWHCIDYSIHGGYACLEKTKEAALAAAENIRSRYPELALIVEDVFT